MGLWGIPEVTALICDVEEHRVRGVRMRARGRDLEVIRAAVAEHADIGEACGRVLEKLSPGGASWLLLGMNLEGGEVFESRLPDASQDALAGALHFEAPREVLTLPEDFLLQYVKTSAADTAGEVNLRGYVFAGKALLKLAPWLAKCRRKLDAFVYPLLALPPDLAAAAKVYMPELEKNFYWQNGMWYANGGAAAANGHEWWTFLHHDCRWPDAGADDWREYATALTVARFGLRKLIPDPSVLAGINVLPGYLRPARYRTQLRLMALLAVLLLGVALLHGWNSWRGGYQTYRTLADELAGTRTRVEKLRKQLKTGEKELKEVTRVAELKIGDRDCLAYLGLLSEKLPDDVLVSSFRWNDGSIDLMLQTESTELDMVSFFNRLNGFKVISASQRTNNNSGLTVATVKLAVGNSEGKRKK